jgi:hypothetical protein
MKVIASRRGFDRARKRIQANPPLIGQERRITLTKTSHGPLPNYCGDSHCTPARWDIVNARAPAYDIGVSSFFSRSDHISVEHDAGLAGGYATRGAEPCRDRQTMSFILLPMWAPYR